MSLNSPGDYSSITESRILASRASSVQLLSAAACCRFLPASLLAASRPYPQLQRCSGQQAGLAKAVASDRTQKLALLDDAEGYIARQRASRDRHDNAARCGVGGYSPASSLSLLRLMDDCPSMASIILRHRPPASSGSLKRMRGVTSRDPRDQGLHCGASAAPCPSESKAKSCRREYPAARLRYTLRVRSTR